MYFCPYCGNLLVPEHEQSINLTCTTCPYFYKLTTVLKHTQKMQKMKIERIANEDEEMKNANKCQAKCPKCTNDEAFYMEIQTRSADEPTTIFYQCTKCKYNWKE